MEGIDVRSGATPAELLAVRRALPAIGLGFAIFTHPAAIFELFDFGCGFAVAGLLAIKAHELIFESTPRALNADITVPYGLLGMVQNFVQWSEELFILY